VPAGRHEAPRVVVVALPAEIDMVNAAQIEGELISGARQDATLIADMSTTMFCDCAGARAVYRAGERAAAAGGELRVVITTAPVRRLFSLIGIDQVLSIYPGLDAAVADSTPRGDRAAPLPPPDAAAPSTALDTA
jgi:anti-sigma B factor antagonist